MDIEKSVPSTKHPARRIPVPIKKEVKEKLDELEKKKVIERVTKPTD